MNVNYTCVCIIISIFLVNFKTIRENYSIGYFQIKSTDASKKGRKIGTNFYKELKKEVKTERWFDKAGSNVEERGFYKQLL